MYKRQVLNALMIWLAAAVVPGFAISGFWAAFFLALLVSIINAVLGGGRTEQVKTR